MKTKYSNKVCKRCGEQFVPTSSRQVYCNREIVVKCQVCGKEIRSTCSNSVPRCCSRECSIELANLSRLNSASKQKRICKLCGKEFLINNSNIGSKERRRTCSSKCTRKLRKSTNLERYGGVSPMSSQAVKAKVEATNLERYGVKHASQNEDIKKKTAQTNLERYGVESVLKSDSIRAKAIETNLSKYGTEHPVQNKSVQDKIRSTCLERYGFENPMQSEDVKEHWRDNMYEKTGFHHHFKNPKIRDKIKSTTYEHYGVMYPLQNSDIKEKMKVTNLKRYGFECSAVCDEVRKRIKETNLERYGHTNFLQSEKGLEATRKTMHEKFGTDWYTQSRDAYLRRMSDPSKIDNMMEFRDNPELYIDIHFDHKPTLRQLRNSVGLSSDGYIVQMLDSLNIRDKIQPIYSYLELEIKNFINDLDPNINVEMCTKQIITPYELDLYLPDYNFAIECNPTSTHNSSISIFPEYNQPTPKCYHKMKTDMCEERGIFLFHIFGYDWTHNSEIIKSMIRNILGKNETKIHGRRTDIREVDNNTAKIFLIENHRQGYTVSKIRYGLYYNDELVSLMTFGKKRVTIGSNKHEDSYELIRFCSKKNTSVIGAANKLFKHFIQEINPSNVFSFSDRAHTRGNLYRKLGFKEVSRSDPGYVWVNEKTDKSYHRMNAQKQNIKKFLKDETIDLSLTEKQIMESHGFVRVYDSGVITWKWSK